MPSGKTSCNISFTFITIAEVAERRLVSKAGNMDLILAFNPSANQHVVQIHVILGLTSVSPNSFCVKGVS